MSCYRILQPAFCLVTQFRVKAVSSPKFTTVWKLKQPLLSSYWHDACIALYIAVLLSIASGGMAKVSRTTKQRQNLAQTTDDGLFLVPTSTVSGDGWGGCLT